jgi:hypothetical protein
MKRRDSDYVLESQVVDDFENIINGLKNPFGIDGLAFEFNYISGKADIIGESKGGDLVAFEAKLKKWRVALNQAYRNSSFAHYSYVLLPEKSCNMALKEEREFIRRGVGLCSLNSAGISIEIQASRKRPIQPWLTKSALKYIAGVGNGREKTSADISC